jgi:hypothetical protein
LGRTVDPRDARVSYGRRGRIFGPISSLPRSILVLGLLIDVLIVVVVMLLLGHRL